jgi:membrane protease YdiL (CAAX protease family)
MEILKNKENKFRSGWQILLILSIVGLASIIVSFVEGMILFILNINSMNGSQEMMVENMEKLISSFNIPILLGQEIIIIVICILCWKLIIKQPLKSMGLKSIKKHSKELLCGLGLGALSITLVFIFIVVTGNAKVTSWNLSFSGDTFLYLILFILVGFAEEILGRGYIISVMKQTRNIPLMVGVSAVIFSLMHILNYSFSLIPFINIALIGVVFALMYIWSGNLWMCIGYHITWNYFQGNVFGFPVSGMESNGIITTIYSENNIINGGGFGPEGGLAVTAIIIAGLLFVRWYYKGKVSNFL